MNASLQQRCKIVRSLYHVHSTKIVSQHVIQWFLLLGEAVRLWNHYTMAIPLETE